MSLADAARALADRGLVALPAKGKSPLVAWKDVATNRPRPEELQRLFKDDLNIWVATGSVSGIVVIDCDNEAGEKFWRDKLGSALLDATTCVKTAKGHHYWLGLPPGTGAPTASSPRIKERPSEPAWDIRGDGAGVIAPPSIHESGVVYSWVRDLDHLQQLPDVSMLDVAAVAGGSKTRSMFTTLIENPPEVGSRDVWMTQVSGHLATWIPFEDAYLALLHKINETLPKPLERFEVEKKIGIHRSHYNMVIEKSPSADSGWLSGTGSRLYTECKSGDERYFLAEWANFDLRVEGVVLEEGRRAYQVTVCVHGKEPQSGLLEASILANNSRLTEWLAQYAATISPPKTDAHSGAYSTRIQRYLESQEPPELQALDSLGWHDGIGFVVHEGIITESGLTQHRGCVPSPHLMGRAPYTYGFAPEQETINALKEVLTFHDETVASVFGSWVIATILKGQIQGSLFPFMALEAPSGSGKTKGMFGMLVAMAGNGRGALEATKAALRASMASHRNGIVWIDDVSDLAAVYELIRQGTSEGSRVKMAEDKTGIHEDKLVAPVLLSGEGLGAIHSEKALLDRSIQLKVPDPTGRLSFHGDYPQWDDMEALRGQYPDFTVFSGTLVRLALRYSHLSVLLPSLRGNAGRHYDKLAILRLGARILAELTGDQFHVGLVDKWCDEQVDTGRSDTLINEVLPWSLRHNSGDGLCRKPAGNPAAYVDESGIVWFHEQTVADRWRERHNLSERDRAMGSLSAIQNQRRALHGGDHKGIKKTVGKYDTGSPLQRVYHNLSAEYSAQVIDHTGYSL